MAQTTQQTGKLERGQRAVSDRGRPRGAMGPLPAAPAAAQPGPQAPGVPGASGAPGAPGVRTAGGSRAASAGMTGLFSRVAEVFASGAAAAGWRRQTARQGSVPPNGQQPGRTGEADGNG